MKKQPCVYILTGQRNGTLYIGVTSDLRKRVWEHINGLMEGFTRKYGLHRLVYYEIHGDMASAITREVLDARLRGHDGEQGWMDFTTAP